MEDATTLPVFEDADGVEDEPEVAEPTADPGSILSGLRSQAEELRADRTTILDIPGWEGRLVMRVKPLKWRVTKEIAKRYDRSTPGAERELASALDSLINACDEVLAIDPNTEKPIRLQTVAPSIVTDDLPVRFDAKLAEVLAFSNVAKARDVLLRLVPVETAIFDLQQRFDAWQKGAIEGDESGE